MLGTIRGWRLIVSLGLSPASIRRRMSELVLGHLCTAGPRAPCGVAEASDR
jgi:hypothetical protein